MTAEKSGAPDAGRAESGLTRPSSRLSGGLGAGAFLCLIVGLGSATELLSSGRSPGERVISGILLFLASAAALGIRLVWISGEWTLALKQLRQAPVRKVESLLVLALYSLKSLSWAVAVCSGLLVCITVTNRDPAVGVAWVTMGSTALAFILKVFLDRVGITVDARLGRFRKTIKKVADQVEAARSTMWCADEELKEIERDLARRLQSLQGEHSETQALAEALSADPARVRALSILQARDRRRNVVVTWLQCGFSIVGGVLLTRYADQLAAFSRQVLSLI